MGFFYFYTNSKDSLSVKKPTLKKAIVKDKLEDKSNPTGKGNLETQPNNPLHGVKLATILERLVAHYGWEALSMRVNINCFKNNPSIKSSLKFLRKTQWARDKVERLYLKLERKR